MSWGCAGFAREPAKLEDQVRFLAGDTEEVLRLESLDLKVRGRLVFCA